MTNSNKRKIEALKRECLIVGDLRTAMICDLAIAGPESLEGADPGTEADMLLSEGWTQEMAIAECERAIEHGIDGYVAWE